MPESNSIGIFQNKRAYNLAVKYNLSIFDKDCYIHNKKLIGINDVKFLIKNMWIDHFLYGVSKPIDVGDEKYIKIVTQFKKDPLVLLLKESENAIFQVC
jgi:hypothetical protein